MYLHINRSGDPPLSQFHTSMIAQKGGSRLCCRNRSQPDTRLLLLIQDVEQAAQIQCEPPRLSDVSTLGTDLSI